MVRRHTVLLEGAKILKRLLPWLCVIGLIAAFAAVPPGPVGHDSGRYYSVAWEMFLHGKWLIPELNGHIYLDKPPLLFWIIIALWHVFGVHAFVIPVVNVFTLLGIAAAGIRILKMYSACSLKNTSQSEVTLVYFLMLLSGNYFILSYLPDFRFDLFISLFLLIGIISIFSLMSFPGNRYAFWGLVLSAALGIFTKGPVFYVYLLPIVLLSLLFCQNRKKLYGLYGIGLLLGTMPFLLWVGYGYWHLGKGFLHYLVFDQTLQRIHKTGGRPFWWYFYSLPIWWMPWIFCIVFWESFKSWRTVKNLPYFKILGLGACFSLLIFSTMAQKEPRYILPLIMEWSLCLAIMMDRLDQKSIVPTLYFVYPIFLPAGLGTFLIFLKKETFWLDTGIGKKFYWIINVTDSAVAAFFVLSLLLVVVLCYFWKKRSRLNCAVFFSASSIGLLFIYILFLLPTAQQFYGQDTFARQLNYYAEKEYTLFAPGYYGDWNFSARLKKPIQERFPSQQEQGKYCLILVYSVPWNHPMDKLAAQHYDYNSIENIHLYCHFKEEKS